jgi:hypothetical protein
MIRIPFCKSTSPISKADASPGRKPVAASKPIKVSKFSAFIPWGEANPVAAVISRAISSSL